MKHTKKEISRRHFLKFATATLGASLLAGGGLYNFRKQRPLTVLNHARSILGTFVHITIHHEDSLQAQRAMQAAYSEIERVDHMMSIHKNSSQLSKINQAAGKGMITVDSELIDVLKIARHTHNQSGGIYDITCLPLMKLYGLYSNSSILHYPSDRELANALAITGDRHITIDSLRREVGLIKEEAAIDLGSIGKGFAVDKAAEALRRHGIGRALINAGGNILAIGSPNDEESGWQIAIRNPDDTMNQPYYELFSLKDAAVATSGNYEQPHRIGQRDIGHIFDMLTGRPTQQGISATVIASTATLADALSTTAFILGPTRREQITSADIKAIYYHGYAG